MGPEASGVVTSERLIYRFEEGSAGQRRLLGGKGANLAEMTRIGLPVPPGFTITTEACIAYYRLGRKFPEGLAEAIEGQLRALEQKTGKRFGDPELPLLVSVRSGAAVSMPGMMDTILNLGLNDQTVKGLARSTGDARFAYDCYRRFIQMFGDVVLGIPVQRFEAILEERRRAEGVEHDHQVSADGTRRVARAYQDLVARESGRPFPEDPTEQLMMAVRAVFESWNNQRAIVYRQIHKIPADLGTAVNVQAMVFGNMGPDSGTGVLFTRNPATGEKALYGEYLTNAQGEDVVAGIRTPRPIALLSQEMPEVYRELERVSDLLERHYRDIQDIEFTVERGRLYVLQTRAGKRTAQAAVKVAVELAGEGIISRETAVGRVQPEQITKFLHRNVDPEARLNVVATGLPASPGAATGQVVFDADTAEALGNTGHRVILVRPETTPDDIHGIVAAQGILTSRGGMTCHAAIVARGMGKPCVVGCEALRIDLAAREFRVGETVVRQGDVVSIDGGTGQVILGEVPLIDPQLTGEFQTLLAWADHIRRLGVRANADTPEDARKAREFGAEGIGLCRTEHMFMAPDRVPVVQAMILAETAEERRAALDRLLPMQQGDFVEILRAMAGLPVTIRLLDPPLHEFLPNVEELVEELGQLRERLREARAAAGTVRAEDVAGLEQEIRTREKVLRRARALAEFNPMLGHRGCRVGIAYPEIYEMQCRAIFQAAAQLVTEGVDVRPEIMIPLVGIAGELELLRDMVLRVAEDVRSETGVEVPVVVGTMIEVPRACVTADAIAAHAEFFSFGTNDLTQTTFGFSRDDAEAKFLHHYLHRKILRENPFATLDSDGVGALMRMAVEKGRAARPGLKIGICGEHGGDPESIAFCHEAGLDYVSCSPFRVPVARLAAAQAALGRRRDDTV